ncbi:MAG TPA: hypothetical protein VMT67_13890 [Terriglobales bacterium]|nr:hypothetical protein [Terriglobales bacterium]
MKLWILAKRDDLLPGHDPWSPWYDKMFGLVVRAETEQKAREVANEKSGDETWEFKDAWLNPSYSTCDELHLDGEEGAIIIDFRQA